MPILFLLTGTVLPMPVVNDKLAHISFYALSAALAALGFGLRRGTAIVLGLVLLGFGTEIAQQLFIESHGGSWGDVAANAGGAGVGFATGAVVARAVSRGGRGALRSDPRSRPRSDSRARPGSS